MPLAEQRADALVQSGRGRGSMAVIALLEQGTILHTVGKYVESNAAFLDAIARMRDYEQRAAVRVGSETGAILTHQGRLAYEGRPHERVLAHAYVAKNYLLMGELAEARAHFLAAEFAQQEAVRINQARIERAQQEIAAAKESAGEKTNAYDPEAAREDARFQEEYARHFQPIEKMTGYTDYQNPYVDWLHSIFLATNPEDVADLESAEYKIRRVAALTDPIAPLMADQGAIDGLLQHRNPTFPPTTWVVFETGTAPSRRTIRLDLPVFLVPGRVDYVGAAFPMLETHDDYDSTLTVAAGDIEVSTELLTDMDRIIAQDFRNELPTIIAKTLFSSAVKASAAYAANQMTRDNPGVNLATRIGTTIYQISQNQADLRTWATIPKQYQVARVPTPQSGTLRFAYDASYGAPYVVEVLPGESNVVFVRSIRRGSPLLMKVACLTRTVDPQLERQFADFPTE